MMSLPFPRTLTTVLALAAILSVTASVQAKTEYQNHITYLGAAWGPDGETIYFLKQFVLKKKTTGLLSGLMGGVETEGVHIWFCRMNWDGSHKQEICEMWPGKEPSVDTQGGPVWMEVNAATSNITFSVEFGMGTVGIWVMGLDGKNLHKPFEPVWNDQEKERVLHASWSPDGSKLVYCKENRRLEVFDFKTSERKPLTEGPRDEHPTWSPKGDWIAFTHNLYDNADKEYSDRRVWLIRPDGSEQKPVVDEKDKPIFGWWPSWSPDGTKVGITDSLLFLADLASHKKEYIDPLPIMGECLPYTFMGHHWGERGWLLENRGGIVVIDEKSKKARLLAASGTYGAEVKGGQLRASDQWGIEPVDLKGKDR